MLLKALLASMVVASVSFTVTQTEAFYWLREWTRRSRIGRVFRCPYCLSHWIAAPFPFMCSIRLFDAGQWLIDYFFTMLVIAWIAAFQVFLLMWLADRTEEE